MSQKGRLFVVALIATLAGCDYDFVMNPNASARAAGGPNSTPDDVTVETIEAAPDTSVVAHLLPGTHSGAEVTGAVIGPEGGSLALGDFEIVVPPGAVTRATRFGIRIPNAAQQLKQGYAYAEFTPHNVDFLVPVIVRLPHATTDADPDASALWWNGGGWDVLPTSTTGDGRISTPVLHFSFYATSRRGFTLPAG